MPNPMKLGFNSKVLLASSKKVWLPSVKDAVTSETLTSARTNTSRSSLIELSIRRGAWVGSGLELLVSFILVHNLADRSIMHP